MQTYTCTLSSVIGRIFWVPGGTGIKFASLGKNEQNFTIKPVYLHTFASWVLGFEWTQQFSGGFYPWVVVAPDHQNDACVRKEKNVKSQRVLYQKSQKLLSSWADCRQHAKCYIPPLKLNERLLNVLLNRLPVVCGVRWEISVMFDTCSPFCDFTAFFCSSFFAQDIFLT